MKKKVFIIVLSTLAAIVALLVAGTLTLLISGNRITVARCIVTDNGNVFMVYDGRPIILNYGKESDFGTGDKLLIVHQAAFMESYPEQTKTVFAIRIGGGSEDDVPEEALGVLKELGWIH